MSSRAKRPRLPINKTMRLYGRDGSIYIVDVLVEQTGNVLKYKPDGIRAIFKVFKLDEEGERVLVVLLDNHEPFGFHHHPKLPNQTIRQVIQVEGWQDAWVEFQKIIRGLVL